MSEDDQFNPAEALTEAQSEQPSEKWIHPDTLKFIGMAKDLLDSPGIKQSVEAGQKQQAESSNSESSNSNEYPLNALSTKAATSQTNYTQRDAQPTLEDQPDTLNFMSMARELLDSPAVRQAAPEGQDKRANTQ